MQVAKSLLGRCFIAIWNSQNLDKIKTIKELLCVKYGLISLPLGLFEVDFMLESLCTWYKYF